MKPLISVITLTHNKRRYTSRCLPTLLHTDYAPWELIVVDNGSTDGTPEWLDRFGAAARAAGVGFTLVGNGGNIGCSTARNQGLARAKGEHVVFVDNDVALRSRNWLSRMESALRQDAGIAAVGPKLVYPYPPYDIQCAGAAVSRSGRVQFIGRGDARDLPQFNREREVQCLISACFMVRRSALNAWGGFDEAFNPVEYEDIDLCYRLRSKGYRILYLPDVEMYHFESVTTGGTPSLPNTYLIVKHGLRFKRRWRQMFEQEDGPADAETRWRSIAPRDIATVVDLPITENGHGTTR